MGKNFSTALSRLIDERGTSVIQIAKAAKVERQTVYNWLAGGYPRREPLKRLCKYLKMTEAELMHGKVEFNDERLTKVIELVEIAADKNSVKLSASKKAKIIALFYQRMAEGDEVSAREVASVVKISA